MHTYSHVTLRNVLTARQLLERDDLGTVQRMFQLQRPVQDVRQTAMDSLLRMRFSGEWDAALGELRRASGLLKTSSPTLELHRSVTLTAVGSKSDGASVGMPEIVGELERRGSLAVDRETPALGVGGATSPAGGTDAPRGASGDLLEQYWQLMCLLLVGLAALRGERPRRIPEVGLARRIATQALLPSMCGFASIQSEARSRADHELADASLTALRQSTLLSYMVLIDYFAKRGVKVWGSSGPDDTTRLTYAVYHELIQNGGWEEYPFLFRHELIGRVDELHPKEDGR